MKPKFCTSAHYFKITEKWLSLNLHCQPQTTVKWSVDCFTVQRSISCPLAEDLAPKQQSTHAACPSEGLTTELDTVSFTYWGRMMHICISELISIGSDNGLSPGRRQAIIWTSAGILLIGTLGTNFSEILIKIHTFSLNKKFNLKMSTKWRPGSQC